MAGLIIYVVVDQHGYGDAAIVGARLTPEEAEALRKEVVAETVEELELAADDEDRDDAQDECDTRYEIVELGA